MTANEIRKAYLDFFKERGHIVLPSASLLPENDPTTLFTGSGMQPMIPFLLGEKHPKGVRLTDSQKCFRSQDIAEVGDNRHTTFFEMLGNWSLGDYFKNEQIPWMFEFLTKNLGLDPQRLYVTCFKGNAQLDLSKDEQSANLWQEEFRKKGIVANILEDSETQGLREGRIFYYDETKNWWSRSGVPQAMPEGEPGGPDSEVFWDFGAERKLHEQSQWKDQPCHVNCDCGRFFEIANNVFMEYKKSAQGFVLLPQKNVDFGGGLERMVAAAQDNPDVFMMDVFTPARETITRVSHKQYQETPEISKAFRVILDHLRATTFLIADGAYPSNKDQGYFTRRLMRRAIRFAQTLGIHEQFCAEVVRAIIVAYKEFYPELVANEALIIGQVSEEEEKFKKTLIKGLKVFEQEIANQPKAVTFSGSATFDLYQSYGFPIEMTEELVRERNMRIDMAEFESESKKHQALSRQGGEKKFHGGLADNGAKTIMGHTATHLLHMALRKVLGEHVQQSGSNITPERFRFDFTHQGALSSVELKQIEDLMNGAIARDYPITWQEMAVEQAYKKNALGFFSDKYDEVVKVYSVGDPNMPASADPTAPTFSQEICGGPHVARTGILGHIRIIKEEALGAGLRRIKAVVEPKDEQAEVEIAPEVK